jgi:hypothetical protein
VFQSGQGGPFLIYIFAATPPCDILSGYQTFYDFVVYPAYPSSSRLFGLSALEEQQRAGALLRTCATLIFLVPFAAITLQLLALNYGVSGRERVGIAGASPESPGTQSRIRGAIFWRVIRTL